MLINRINNLSFDKILIINLNYDTIFENALEVICDVRFKKINDYISVSDKWKVVKPHGCITWYRRLVHGPDDIQGNTEVSFRTYLDRIEEIRFEGDIEVQNEVTDQLFFIRDTKDSHTFYKAVYPIMVIPVEGKYEYCCPKDHVAAAQEIIQECDAYLVIGSSFKDRDVTDMIKAVEKKRPARLVDLVTKCSRDDEEILNISSSISECLTGPRPHTDGFGQFIISRELEKFLGKI